MAWLAKAVRRGPKDVLLAAEALLLLAAFRIALAVVPVRRIIAALCRPSGVEDRHADTTRDHESERRMRTAASRVQWAVSAAVRHAPVEFVCFPQALAGYAMLRRRGVPGTVIYGVARSPAGDLIAHTWLTAGDRILLGEDAAKDFTAIERWT